MLKTFVEAEAELAKYIPKVRELLGKDLTVERIRPLMRALGNPEEKLKIIHIAGTSGKTSTAYYIAGLLKEAGQKVGLTVSPHIDSVAERVQINLKPLNESEFCKALGEFLEIIKNVEPEPTYFELLIAFAYWYFAHVEVDYAVIETGMGGLHDATNIAQNPDKICVITDIGLDHTKVLGDSIDKIAAQKAGIIHPNNQVFMYKQSTSINTVVEKVAKKQKAKLNLLSFSDIRACKTDLSDFQKRNWCLAVQVYEFIAKRDQLPSSNQHQLNASQQIIVPGRMESLAAGNKLVIMDGAHNQQKMQAFVVSFGHKYPGQEVPILISLKNDKDQEQVLRELSPICSQLIITKFKTSEDLPAAPTDPKALEISAKQAGLKNITVEPDPIKAYNSLLHTESNKVVVTGSFYLLADLRQLILK